MKKYCFILFLLLFGFIGCKKDTSLSGGTKTQLGYDHSTPEGKYLSKLALGSKRLLTTVIFTYYNGTSELGTYPQSYPTNHYLSFDDGPATTTNYTARSVVSNSGGPISNNTTSNVLIEHGLYYLLYQPDVNSTPTSSPLTVIKIEVTPNYDFNTLTLKFTDTTPGIATEGPSNIAYTSRVRIYTYVGI